VSVGSLDVPMSPGLDNVRWRGTLCDPVDRLPQGLISTERTHSHENHPPSFWLS
jgi:hypothetical protein